MPTYKLMYFNGRGRAEMIRMLFVLKGQDFEDFRFSSQEEWANVKGDTKQFPLGQAPVLVIDGHVMPQSAAIGRYLAGEFGYYGDNNKDKAHIDVICETMEDIGKKMSEVFLERDETKKAELVKTFKETSTTAHFTYLAERIKAAGGKYFVGNKISLADVVVFCYLDALQVGILKVDGAVELYPDLMKFYGGIKDDSPLKSYLQKRPETPF